MIDIKNKVDCCGCNACGDICPTDLLPLLARIGDLAWCYTTTGRPGAPYAAILAHSFRNFQETIGHFTPDYEITPIYDFNPVPGQNVVILNGLLSDRHFDIERIERTPDTIVRLYMTADNGIQWRTTARLHQLRPGEATFHS